MQPDKAAIDAALRTVKYPGFSRDIVSFGLVREAVVTGSKIVVKCEVTTNDPGIPAKLEEDIKAALGQVAGIEAVSVDIKAQQAQGAPAQQNQNGQVGGAGIPGVDKIIAIASGKGGVGKSTVTTNLAVALERLLAEKGRPGKVGILDCDIYGPSIPQMMGVQQRPEIEDDKIVPLENFGVRIMSMGLLIDENTPVVWRGPMVTKAIMQFCQQVHWGELDYLVVDLPPGTGDAQLTLAQTLPLTGAVIVTTPQEVAVSVARRGATMFEKVNVPYLGVIENMSYLEMPDGSKQHIFGSGGGKLTAESLKTELLGQIPLDPRIREGADRGIPINLSDPEGKSCKEFKEIALKLIKS